MSESLRHVDLPLELEYAILDRLATAGRPSGCGSLWVELQDDGFPKSPTTVGRILHRLDLRGYTMRVGYRGRALTEAGERRLAKLREVREREDSQGLLLESVQPSTLGELLDLLVARRAIEREIARLAALRATDRHIEALWAALADQRAVVHERGIAIDEDRRFHETLADASGNRFLAGTLRFIRRNVDMQRLLEELRRGRASGLIEDHKAVVEAVARHDPGAAEAAMVQHLEHIIDDILSYCRAHPDGFDARTVQVLGEAAPTSADVVLDGPVR